MTKQADYAGTEKLHTAVMAAMPHDPQCPAPVGRVPEFWPTGPLSDAEIRAIAAEGSKAEADLNALQALAAAEACEKGADQLFGQESADNPPYDTRSP